MLALEIKMSTIEYFVSKLYLNHLTNPSRQDFLELNSKCNMFGEMQHVSQE